MRDDARIPARLKMRTMVVMTWFVVPMGLRLRLGRAHEEDTLRRPLLPHHHEEVGVDKNSKCFHIEEIQDRGQSGVSG